MVYSGWLGHGVLSGQRAALRAHGLCGVGVLLGFEVNGMLDLALFSGMVGGLGRIIYSPDLWCIG
jgi:hypothetical protein